MRTGKIIAWSVLVTFSAYAGLTNFLKFAERPSAPLCWIDQSENAAIQLAHKIDNEPESEQRRKDMREYIWLLLEARNREHAHDMAAANAPARPAVGSYDKPYEEKLQQLAVAELMHDCSPDMLQTLLHMYDYDKQHAGNDSRRMGRDANNLGLAFFLVGQNSEDVAYRATSFKQSEEWLGKAEQLLSSGPKSDILAVRENQLMLAEARRDKQLADHYHKQIDALISELNGGVPHVTL